MYLNINGILMDLISKEQFELILENKGLTYIDICDFLKISTKRYFKLISGTKDFTELEILKLEKFLDTRIIKTNYKSYF